MVLQMNYEFIQRNQIMKKLYKLWIMSVLLHVKSAICNMKDPNVINILMNYFLNVEETEKMISTQEQGIVSVHNILLMTMNTNITRNAQQIVNNVNVKNVKIVKIVKIVKTVKIVKMVKIVKILFDLYALIISFH